MKQILKMIIVKVLGLSYARRNIDIVVHPSVTQLKVDEVISRLNFFLGAFDFVYHQKRKKSIPFLIPRPTIAIGFKDTSLFTKLFRGYFYNMDFDLNPNESLEYHYLFTFLKGEIQVSAHKIRFKEAVSSIKRQFPYDKCYIFGTGPSLEKALAKSWGDGVRIVSNTIVKDQQLWNHINPHVIAAGDAIYHFGLGRFAVNFRSDLRKRLAETDTIFVYPAFFHAFCLREFSGFESRLFPVPIGSHTRISHNLSEEYSLPNMPNVLPLLLLPIACSFSEAVYLWGFDGRAPNDKDFWKNSDKHFYQADVEQLKTLHPSFFNKLIPVSNEASYVNKVHGDALEQVLRAAEENGFTFNMMHFSYTPVLSKRNKVQGE